MAKKILYSVLVFVTWRLIILAFQIFIQPQYLITRDSELLYDRLFTSWILYWDAGHYLSIASSGYNFPQQAFFPLWPLLIKVTTMMGFSFQWASYLLTLALGLANFVLFYLLADKLIGSEKAKWSLIIFSVYPATMFLHAGYSENLFLFLTLLSFYFLERKKYWLSAFTGGLSTAARMTGVATALSFIFMGLRLRTKVVVMSLIGVFGLMLYMTYLYFYYGDPWFFVKGQQEWCQAAGRCQFVFPLNPLLEYGYLILIGWAKPSLSHLFLDWVSSVIFLAFLPMVWKSLPKHYFIYTLTVLMMPLLSGTSISMIRMTLIAFPVFFVIPSLINNRKLLFGIALILVILEMRFVAFFTSRIWIA